MTQPCCIAAAARAVKQLEIDGALIGIAQLDRIFAELSAERFDTEEAVTTALMAKVRVYNYVPPNAADEYRDAISAEYLKSRKLLSKAAPGV